MIVLEEEDRFITCLFIVVDTAAKEAKHSGFVLKCFSVAPVLVYE